MKKWLVLLLLFMNAIVRAQVDVVIINDNVGQGATYPTNGGPFLLPTNMRWDSACTLQGYTDTIVTQTYLDSVAFLNTAKAIIITNSYFSNIDAAQIAGYLQAGISVYIQSRDDTTAIGNQAFSYLVNNLGGTFVWGPRFTSNSNRIISGSLQYLTQLVNYCPPVGCGATTINNFNGAVSNSHSCNVVGFFLFKSSATDPLNGRETGWMFRPGNPAYGRLITITDTRWMTQNYANAVNPGVVLPFLRNMLYHLVNPWLGDTSNNKYVTVYDTICPAQLPYSWNGQQVLQGGVSAAAFQMPSDIGCDSITTLSLYVKPTYNETVNVNICPNELPYIWNGLTVSSIGNNVAVYPTSSVQYHCDSIVHLNLMPKPTYNMVVSQAICPNQLPYVWNGMLVADSGNAVAVYHTTSANFGCDSIVTLNLALNLVFNDTIVMKICGDKLPYTWNGTTITTLGHQLVVYTTTSTQYGCDSTAILDLTVLPPPVISLGAIMPDYSRSFCIGDSIAISVSGDAVSYQWYLDNALVSVTNPGIVRLASKVNNITVVGVDMIGCDNRMSFTQNAENCCGVNFPNAFSPNGDGLNDEYGPVAIGHPNFFSISVFDRLGHRVFISNSIHDTWDGTYNGKEAAAGVYFYMSRTECADHSMHEFKGDLTLVR